MQQSPVWEASGFSASQEIPRILWTPKIRSRMHKFPPPVVVLSNKEKYAFTKYSPPKKKMEDALPDIQATYR